MANRMRRILCALLACVLFAAALPSAMAQTTYSMYFCKSTKVYQKASSSSRSLSVPKNMKVTMLAARGDWALVKNGNCYAFCKLADLNLCSRLKGYVVSATPLYASASKRSKHTDSIGVNTEVYVIGIDGCSVGYDQVREGTQALCIGQSFSQMTQDAFTCITKLMNGETLESDVVWTEPDIVNAETIDNFPYPEW